MNNTKLKEFLESLERVRRAKDSLEKIRAFLVSTGIIMKPENSPGTTASSKYRPELKNQTRLSPLKRSLGRRERFLLTQVLLRT